MKSFSHLLAICVSLFIGSVALAEGGGTQNSSNSSGVQITVEPTSAIQRVNRQRTSVLDMSVNMTGQERIELAIRHEKAYHELLPQLSADDRSKLKAPPHEELIDQLLNGPAGEQYAAMKWLNGQLDSVPILNGRAREFKERAATLAMTTKTREVRESGFAIAFDPNIKALAEVNISPRTSHDLFEKGVEAMRSDSPEEQQTGEKMLNKLYSEGFLTGHELDRLVEIVTFDRSFVNVGQRQARDRFRSLLVGWENNPEIASHFDFSRYSRIQDLKTSGNADSVGFAEDMLIAQLGRRGARAHTTEEVKHFVDSFRGLNETQFAERWKKLQPGEALSPLARAVAVELSNNSNEILQRTAAHVFVGRHGIPDDIQAIAGEFAMESHRPGDRSQDAFLTRVARSQATQHIAPTAVANLSDLAKDISRELKEVIPNTHPSLRRTVYDQITARISDLPELAEAVALDLYFGDSHAASILAEDVLNERTNLTASSEKRLADALAGNSSSRAEAMLRRHPVNHEQARVREHANKATSAPVKGDLLARIQNPDAHTVARLFLLAQESNNPSVARQAAYRLMEITPAPSMQIGFLALNTSDPITRERAIERLGALSATGDSTAAGYLAAIVAKHPVEKLESASRALENATSLGNLGQMHLLASLAEGGARALYAERVYRRAPLTTQERAEMTNQYLKDAKGNPDSKVLSLLVNHLGTVTADSEPAVADLLPKLPKEHQPVVLKKLAEMPTLAQATVEAIENGVKAGTIDPNLRGLNPFSQARLGIIARNHPLRWVRNAAGFANGCVIKWEEFRDGL